MKQKCEQLRALLRRDGLDFWPFVMMAFAWAWCCPDWSYRDILKEYAAYVDDAPERVHAELCRRILATDLEIGPEEYLGRIVKEVLSADN